MTLIIWPEHRVVSDETIISWYLDAVADGKIEIELRPDDPTPTVDEMARALDDIGWITLGRQS